MKSLWYFALAAVLEIAGCFAFWQWERAGRSAWWPVLGLVSLAGFAWLLAKVDVAFAGRAYAAYGGIYIGSALLWLWIVEKQRPDPWDLLGAGFCVCGTLIILLAPRSAI